MVLRVLHIDGSEVNVPLSCGEAFQGQPIIWKKNGVLRPDLHGNHIQVSVQEWDGGNYSCHLATDGQYLNHTVIMIQLRPDNRTVILRETSPEGGYIHCSTPNYRGSFHCTWTRTEHRSDAAVLKVTGHRNQETVPCQLDPTGSRIDCEDNVCPYKEEQHRISLTLFIHSDSRLEQYTKTFFLWEIVTPESVHNLRYSPEESVFRWDYPKSWEKLCSYFSLRFQVKVVHSGHSCDTNDHVLNETTPHTKHEVLIKAKKYVFCVRAQDKYTGGPWSHWSKCIVNRDHFVC